MSGKRTQLTDVEKFFVESNPQSLLAEELAEKLDVSLASIKKAMSKSKSANKTPTEQSSPKGNQILKDGIVNKTLGGKKGIAILTPGASEMMDDTNKAARARAKRNTTSFTAKSYPEREEKD